MVGINKIKKDVEKIIKAVEKDGDKALINFTGKFDGLNISLNELEVDRTEWEEKAGNVDDNLLNILREASQNIEKYSERQNIYKDFEFENNGIHIKDKFIPVESVGIYVPGGEYSYPSTVLMCAIPAKAAGVKNVYMVTPPKNLTPVVLAAAKIAGVDRIFRVGGAHSIAALAFGTETIPKVDKIVGPGNIYVQFAKMNLSDVVGIDMIAGPSEVVIIADEFQRADWIAFDLMAQAEHASDATGILFTYSDKLFDEVKSLIPEQLSGRIKLIKVENVTEAVSESNNLAPEHLQVMCSDENINKIEGKIRNAGAVFLGSKTPVAFGDYWAGPSHTLPTGRSARFQEGLNVRSFLKKVSFIRCDDEHVRVSADSVEKFASEEGMKYHAESIKKRTE
jgi:histidinol dehydrogenase